MWQLYMYTGPHCKVLLQLSSVEQLIILSLVLLYGNKMQVWSNLGGYYTNEDCLSSQKI